MFRGKLIEEARRVVPPFFKKMLGKVIRHSEPAIINDSFFPTNEITIPIRKNIPVDKEWELLKKGKEHIRTDENIEKNPLIFTHHVSFELSNLCNYAPIHRKCPLNLAREPVILPEKIVFDILDTLAKYNFTGRIAFHNYNEPLIDPRLLKFVEYARNACPDADIYISTNGYYLNQILADELVADGVSSIFVSAYSQSEFGRLSKIKVNIPFDVWKARLDDRLHLYEAEENDIGEPCFAPLNEIVITCEGEISLCCLDWRRRYSFGNVQEQSLEEIIKSKEVQMVYQRLSRGDRFLDLCKRCEWSR